MKKAFEEAGAQAGSGMKRRMVDILGNYAREVATVMFHDLERRLFEGVRSLSDWLLHEFGKMTDTARRQSDIAIQNLRVDRGKMSSEEIEQACEVIADLQRALGDLAPNENVAASILLALSGDGNLALALGRLL